ncbi:MAG: hypothetical protein J0I07_37430 [Myxococcales bacterium]|nr:hypothetical protein [Myxococcales bacterium]
MGEAVQVVRCLRGTLASLKLNVTVRRPRAIAFLRKPALEPAASARRR